MSFTEQFTQARPAGGFKVILADPPWRFETFSEKGKGKSAERHYDTMSIEEISAMPVGLLAAKDCSLFLWGTFPIFRQWAIVLDAWGFTESGLAWVWAKYNPTTTKFSFGGGYGTRKNLEPCLLAKRGNPSLKTENSFFGEYEAAEGTRSVRDMMFSPRREHSRKPDEQYDRIETLFDGPYVELFSRSGRNGWTSLGDQVGKFEEVA